MSVDPCIQSFRSLAARRLSYLLMLIAVVGSLGYAFPPQAQAQSAAKNSAIVTGWVHDAKTGQGIASAIVHVGSTMLTTDAQGNLPRTSVPLSGSTLTTEVEVIAEGYPMRRYSGLELAAGQTTELRIELSDQPPRPQSKPAAPRPASIFDGPPEFIDVGRTFSTNCVFPPTNVQRVDRMPFIDYVRNVLPNEWVNTWPDASLDAGAVAVMQYAWSEAFVKQKWRAQGYPFDVVDSTCDQVYKDRDSSKDYTRTDAAVARMWGTILTRGGTLVTTYYRAKDSQCGSRDCMGQWGTYNLANRGYSGLQILFSYYGESGNLRAYATAPKHRGLVLHRSPDVTVWPGRSQTLSVKLRNTGTATWQKGATQLIVIDSKVPTPTPVDSPLVNETWLSPQQPATLLQTKAVIGMDGTWSVTVMAPEGLKPGRYQIAVQPRHEDGSWIAVNTPIVWNVTVTEPLTPAIWLPGVRSGS